jgi:hypothetical protein
VVNAIDRGAVRVAAHEAPPSMANRWEVISLPIRKHSY